MQRRTLLKRLTAVTAAGALAGCLDDGEPDEGAGGNGDDEGDDETDDGVDNGTDDDIDDGDDNGTDDDTDDEGGNGTDDDTDDEGGNGTDDEDGDENGDGEDADGPKDERIETVAAECAEGDGAKSEATVSFGDDTVELKGTIGSSDPCHEAVLEEVTTEDGGLTVTVVVESDDEDACQQCLGRLEYEATLEFDESPEHVTVVHAEDEETTTVAEAERDG